MEHAFGHCDLRNADVLSIIPLRDDRIDSEVNFGVKILKLKPNKSVLENKFNYEFDPYVTYSRNPLKTRTCIFSFVDGSVDLPHDNLTNKTERHFECRSEVCKNSIEEIKEKERIQLKTLHEEFPICEKNELHRLLKLNFNEQKE